MSTDLIVQQDFFKGLLRAEAADENTLLSISAGWAACGMLYLAKSLPTK